MIEPSAGRGVVGWQRFTVLDGLRGVAAVAVVLYHANVGQRLPYLLPGAYLAVDFFFVLSGFVIAHAYGAALQTRRLTSASFLKIRAIRLGPLAYLGAFIGLAVVLLAPGSVAGDLRNNPLFPVIAATGLLLAPNIVPGVTPMYPLDTPLWSLFYEFLVNGAYVLVAPRLSTKLLAILLAGAGAGAVVALVGVHGEAYGGPARVCYPFFAGVLVHRLWRAGKRAPDIHPLALGAALIAAFFNPDVSPLLRTAVNGVCALVVFPLIVWIAASSTARGFWERVCDLSGEVSYPLYVIHFPLVLLITPFLVRLADPRAVVGALILSVTGLALLALWLSRMFDRPVRAALQRLLSRAAPPSPAAIEQSAAQ